MAAFIKYIGTAHYRVLDNEDLKKFGVKGFRSTTWGRGEALEVTEQVAEALLDNLDDEFELAEEVEPGDDDPNKVNWVTRVKQGQTEPPEPAA